MHGALHRVIVLDVFFDLPRQVRDRRASFVRMTDLCRLHPREGFEQPVVRTFRVAAIIGAHVAQRKYISQSAPTAAPITTTNDSHARIRTIMAVPRRT